MFPDNDSLYVFLCFVSRLRRVGCPDKQMKLSYFKYTPTEVTKDEPVLNQSVWRSLSVSIIFSHDREHVSEMYSHFQS